jgi:hypothetical protein
VVFLVFLVGTVVVVVFPTAFGFWHFLLLVTPVTLLPTAVQFPLLRAPYTVVRDPPGFFRVQLAEEKGGRQKTEESKEESEEESKDGENEHMITHQYMITTVHDHNST